MYGDMDFSTVVRLSSIATVALTTIINCCRVRHLIGWEGAPAFRPEVNPAPRRPNKTQLVHVYD